MADQDPGRRDRRQLADQGRDAPDASRTRSRRSTRPATTSPRSSRTAGTWRSATATGRRSGSSCAARSWPPTSSTRSRSTSATPTARAPSATSSSRPSATTSGRLGIDRQAVTVVTQVEVAADDPAFGHPTKPIGTFMDEERATRAARRTAGTSSRTPGAAGAGSSPSPRPIRIVEQRAVKSLIAAGFVVITVGGGGIPVVADAAGCLHGVAAVIDKDYASSLLAPPDRRGRLRHHHRGRAGRARTGASPTSGGSTG